MGTNPVLELITIKAHTRDEGDQPSYVFENYSKLPENIKTRIKDLIRYFNNSTEECPRQIIKETVIYIINTLSNTSSLNRFPGYEDIIGMGDGSETIIFDDGQCGCGVKIIDGKCKHEIAYEVYMGEDFIKRIQSEG